MAENVRDHRARNVGDTAPDQVIKHMIALADYAEAGGFPAFEAKLLDAVEAFLNELNEEGRPAEVPRGAYGGANIVPFSPAARFSGRPASGDEGP